MLMALCRNKRCQAKDLNGENCEIILCKNRQLFFTFQTLHKPYTVIIYGEIYGEPKHSHICPLVNSSETILKFVIIIHVDLVMEIAG